MSAEKHFVFDGWNAAQIKKRALDYIKWGSYQAKFVSIGDEYRFCGADTVLHRNLLKKGEKATSAGYFFVCDNDDDGKLDEIVIDTEWSSTLMIGRRPEDKAHFEKLFKLPVRWRD